MSGPASYSWSPTPPGLCRNSVLFQELAVPHGRLPGGKRSSFLLAAQLPACASILDVERVVGVLYCLKRRSQAQRHKKSLLQASWVFRAAGGWDKAVSQSRSPVLCHSWRHRLIGGGSRDCSLQACVPRVLVTVYLRLSGGIADGQEPGRSLSWRCWYLNGRPHKGVSSEERWKKTNLV